MASPYGKPIMLGCMPAGLQLSITSLAGQAVALAAHTDLLAVVWHAGMPAQDGDQNLAYSLVRVGGQALVHSGRMCVSPQSELEWIGFSDEGILATYDSKV
jgi:chromosome transmission fidelity protein 4